MSILSKSGKATLTVAALVAVTVALPVGGRAQSGSLDGAQLYQAKCASCHGLAGNKIGPSHKGIFGRKAAIVAGYNYSPALRKSGLTWDEKTLDQWLQGPQKVVKGSRMYLVVSDPAERAAIIAYLRSDAVR